MRGLNLAFEDIRNMFVHLGNKVFTKARINLICRPKVKSEINIRSLYYFHNDGDFWASSTSICSSANKRKYFWYMAECIHD
jgi:hypothetical protein